MHRRGAAVGVDGRVLAFTAFVSVLTGLVFGLFPALRAARVDLSTVMKESAGRSGTGFKQNKTRAVLVITEIALALILLVGAALLIRTYIALRAVDPGFDPQRVLTMRMSLTGERFAKTATIGQLMRQGRERLEALPEVEAAAASCCVPLQGGFGLGFIIEGRPLEGPAHGGGSFTPISANYFNVFKIPVLRGRYFTDSEIAEARHVVLVSDSFARQYFPGEDPIGKRITVEMSMEPVPTEIVGIVANARYESLVDEAYPMVYMPIPELTYPFHDRDILVTACGRICLHRKKINISTVLAGQKLGIKEVDDGIWLVSFSHYDLGYFDLEQKTLQPLDNPFGPRLSPMS